MNSNGNAHHANPSGSDSALQLHGGALPALLSSADRQAVAELVAEALQSALALAPPVLSAGGAEVSAGKLSLDDGRPAASCVGTPANQISSVRSDRQHNQFVLQAHHSTELDVEQAADFAAEQAAIGVSSACDATTEMRQLKRKRTQTAAIAGLGSTEGDPHVDASTLQRCAAQESADGTQQHSAATHMQQLKQHHHLWHTSLQCIDINSLSLSPEPAKVHPCCSSAYQADNTQPHPHALCCGEQFQLASVLHGPHCQRQKRQLHAMPWCLLDGFSLALETLHPTTALERNKNLTSDMQTDCPSAQACCSSTMLHSPLHGNDHGVPYALISGLSSCLLLSSPLLKLFVLACVLLCAAHW